MRAFVLQMTAVRSSNTRGVVGFALGKGPLAAGVLILSTVLAGAGCTFDPVARPVKRERLMDGPVRVIRTLDPYGVHALIRYDDENDMRAYAITDWHVDKRCVLPTDVTNIFDPLQRSLDQRDTAKDLLVPIARGTAADDLTLWIVDENCALDGPLGGVVPSTTQIISSAEDQRNLMLFRDSANTLFLFDSATSEVTQLAENVQDVRPGTTGDTRIMDAFWLREGPHLTERAIDGRLLVSLGDNVTQFALYGGIVPRVAYVDGGDLFEAAAPQFQPVLRAEGACDPSYPGANLELHVPCDLQQLVRVDLSTGKVKEFEPNVFGSVTLDELQFDYARVKTEDDAGTTELQLYLEGPSIDRQRIDPVLRSETLVVLNRDSVAGQTLDDTFGIWQVPSRIFNPLFANVAALIPLLDTRASEYIWLMHHDVVDDIGTLSVFTQTDLTLKNVANGVPLYQSRGFIIDGGRAIPKFPYPESILVFIDNAVPLQSTATRFKGRLRAQLLSGALGAELSEDVSSFFIVASPLPGVLFGIEEGPDVGLWFAAL